MKGSDQMTLKHILIAVCFMTACSGSNDAPADNQVTTEPVTNQTPSTTLREPATVDALQMAMLDCGRIEVADLDAFSSAGDYAGQTDTFTDTCWLIRHPEGELLWDLGLPSALAGRGALENGVFTISLETTISEQLIELGLFAPDIDYISISHSHFDHIGQADQFQSARWIVHADEYAAMFPQNAAPETSDAGSETDESITTQFIDFMNLEREEFTAEYDVFGDGKVVIIPTPGHTPGHTSLLVDLPETGPVLLTGDLYHRTESRNLKRVPRFNTDEAETLVSMDVFEAKATELGARVIIQHDADSIADLPRSPDMIR